MKALKNATSSQDKKRLSAQCQTLLGQAERIKEAHDVAPLILQMAKMHMTEATRAMNTAKDLLSDRDLPPKEQIILMKGSSLNGFVFPPWKGALEDEEFLLMEGQAPFMYVEVPIYIGFMLLLQVNCVVIDWLCERGGLAPSPRLPAF
jgi:hypothetical protein